MVARDGVEPPTPAFSGPNAAALIPLILRSLSPFSLLFPLSYWNILEQDFGTNSVHQTRPRQVYQLVHRASLRLGNELLIEL
jgi:hypothetical protein